LLLPFDTTVCFFVYYIEYRQKSNVQLTMNNEQLTMSNGQWAINNEQLVMGAGLMRLRQVILNCGGQV
jgi:hypothetical protein